MARWNQLWLVHPGLPNGVSDVVDFDRELFISEPDNNLTQINLTGLIADMKTWWPSIAGENIDPPDWLMNETTRSVSDAWVEREWIYWHNAIQTQAQAEALISPRRSDQ
jgi:hypothetical protein